jgi:hypothetical protein
MIVVDATITEETLSAATTAETLTATIMVVYVTITAGTPTAIPTGT